MLCGLTRLVSRIKWLFGYSFSKTKRPFETGKCHECLWCEFFDNCQEDYKYFVKGDYHDEYQEWCDTVYGETDEMLLWNKECQENEFTEALLDDLEHTNYR